ncbi:Tm-1-like ATP-binding domain-containing protein, partial [Sphingomonas sp. H39-1-10]
MLLLCTLDTKAEEARYLRAMLENEGVEVVHLDTSIRETIAGAEIAPPAIAAAAGTDIAAVRALGHEGKAQAVMIEGAIRLAHAADAEAPLSAILAIGGSMGTTHRVGLDVSVDRARRLLALHHRLEAVHQHASRGRHRHAGPRPG